MERFLVFGLLAFLITAHAQSTARVDGNLSNFKKVSEKLYRGGRPRNSGVEELKALGIETVINLQGGDADYPVIGKILIADLYEPGERASVIREERKRIKANGMTFFNFPLSSMQQVTPDAEVMIHRILKILDDPKNGPVYIHCEHGKDRTGLLIALHRVCHDGWTPEQAYHEMLAMGHGGRLNLLFTKAMDDFFHLAMQDSVAWCRR